MLPVVHGEFRCVDDPELRFTPSGKAVATVRLVANSRKKEGDEWVDDKVCWLRLTAFGVQAENLAEAVKKSSLITVLGKLQTEEWEDREGNKRQTYSVLADSIGPSLQKYESSGRKAERSSSSRGDDDPWAAPSEDTKSDEPPF